MKKYLLIISLIFCSFISISAQSKQKEITLTKAGTLVEELSNEEIALLESIKINGPIDSRDIALLANMSKGSNKLKFIDLKEAIILKTEVKENSILNDSQEYFLPNIEVLGKSWEKSKGEEYEINIGHDKSPNSYPGLWMFVTNKKLFFMTGYVNGFDNTITEVVLKTRNEDYIRSVEVRNWIKNMGYVYVESRDDGDDVFKHREKDIWLLLHYKVNDKNDYPGIHFSNEKY